MKPMNLYLFENQIEAVDHVKWETRADSRSEAARSILRAGLEALTKSPDPKTAEIMRAALAIWDSAENEPAKNKKG